MRRACLGQNSARLGSICPTRACCSRCNRSVRPRIGAVLTQRRPGGLGLVDQGLGANFEASNEGWVNFVALQQARHRAEHHAVDVLAVAHKRHFLLAKACGERTAEQPSASARGCSVERSGMGQRHLNKPDPAHGPGHNKRRAQPRSAPPAAPIRPGHKGELPWTLGRAAHCSQARGAEATCSGQRQVRTRERFNNGRRRFGLTNCVLARANAICLLQIVLADVPPREVGVHREDAHVRLGSCGGKAATAGRDGRCAHGSAPAEHGERIPVCGAGTDTSCVPGRP